MALVQSYSLRLSSLSAVVILSDYEYKIEYEEDFSNLVLHTATRRKELSGNVKEGAGLKFESCSYSISYF